jgi:hypothetical protein
MSLRWTILSELGTEERLSNLMKDNYEKIALNMFNGENLNAHEDR